MGLNPMKDSVAPATEMEQWDTANSLMHAAGTMPKPDFSGWATKANIECSDGRTILPDAFKHQDKMQVPLVWQHGHSNPDNVLGHAVLEARAEGVYAYGYFNKTGPAGQARALVEHGDIASLSIFANQLKEAGKRVSHGIIRELSLVLAGANPGAVIENVELQHSDGSQVVLDDEAVIYTGTELEHSDGPGTPAPKKEEPGKKDDEEDELEHATVQEVYDGFSDEQKKVVHYMVGAALEDTGAKHSSTDNNNEGEVRHMSRNVFENGSDEGSKKDERISLSHDDLEGIKADAARSGSMKEAVEKYALAHGIENLDLLFPDAKTLQNTPEWDKRRTEWVSSVINGTRHIPFTRIKSVVADITHDEARARGYIKGNFKKEEWFGLTKRTTGPTTIYKKQQLDRDDIIDITDFDIVAWLKGEMRLMLDEEIARAVLIGDGREVDDSDKIRDPGAATDGMGIRSIANEHELYAATVNIQEDASATETVDGILENMQYYKGSGSPTLYTTTPQLTKMLLARDPQGRRYYRTASDLAAELGVSSVVTVEVMEGQDDLFGIIVNLTDYALGADRGGEVSMFDDFDIDYNQYKYLIETRVSGALTKIRSALVIRLVGAQAIEATPERPAYNKDTGVITVKSTTGVDYKRADTSATVLPANPITLSPGQELKIVAVPKSGYYFETNQTDEFPFTRANS